MRFRVKAILYYYEAITAIVCTGNLYMLNVAVAIGPKAGP